MKYVPHPYQGFGQEHAIKNKYCGLILDMGLGKTVISATVIDVLTYEDLSVSKTLIIAPLFVGQNTWPEEFAKWDHLRHITVSVVAGKNIPGRVAALKAKADVYIINRENVSWLVDFYQTAWPFDLTIIDELSSFKDPSSNRFKSLRIARPRMKRVIGLTGTLMPNGLWDVWSQVYLLDQGERLGKNITAFREAFLVKKESGFGYRARKGAIEEVQALISDICISMKKEDYLQLPGRMEHVIQIRMDDALQKKYDDFEEEQIMTLLDETKASGKTDIPALSAGALTGKLLQFSNGAIYDREKNVHPLHDLKLNALEELVEQAAGSQVLIAYNYQHDRDRILKRFPKARQLTGPKDIADWNKGKVGIMITHPLSAGHGLNLQAGGNIIVWFGPTWSLELDMQFNARLDRQGQTKPVQVYRLVCTSTMDEQVIKALAAKQDGQDAMMRALKARIDYYKNLL